MPTFNLSNDTVSRLRTKFAEFQNARKRVHALIADYVADYRQFCGNPSDRREFLERKYAPRVPDFSHLVFDDSQIFFNVSDIAILLGRSQPAISITLSNIERSQGWVSRLVPLRKQSKSANDNKIFIYSEGIFDLLIDRYEDEYLLRFSKPRRGSQENAPDIEELRKFWKYLHDIERRNEFLALRQQSDLPDIPAMTLRDILALIWDKVFNIRIGSVASLVFAVCFEVARRYFSISLWLSIVPITVICACIVLIHRRYAPDTLSDIGAGALLFLMLWISGSLSLYKSEPLKIAQNITLSPALYGNGFHYDVFFNISATDSSNIKEFLFRISPDIHFRSTGFINQINPLNNQHYPEHLIRNNIRNGRAYIDIKYIDFSGHESNTWLFSFDIDAEHLNLCKQHILQSNFSWVGLKRFNNTTIIFVHPDLLVSYQGKKSIKRFIYGLNSDMPDSEITPQYFYDNQMKVANPYVFFSSGNDYIKYVSSYIVFNDDTSSDIRISRIKD